MQRAERLVRPRWRRDDARRCTAALVLALGLRPAARRSTGSRRATARRSTCRHLRNHVARHAPGLRYNAPSGSESIDVGPTDDLTRAQVAYSFYRATTQPSWNVPNLLDAVPGHPACRTSDRRARRRRAGACATSATLHLGRRMGFGRRPYPALGGQPRPGFDCSGLTWWLLRADDGAPGTSPATPLRGWSLPQRTSADMARMTNREAHVPRAPPGRHHVLRRRRRRHRRPRRHVHRSGLRARFLEHAGRRDHHVGRGRLVPRPLRPRPPGHPSGVGGDRPVERGAFLLGERHRPPRASSCFTTTDADSAATTPSRARTAPRSGPTTCRTRCPGT